MSYLFLILIMFLAAAISRTAIEKKQFENFYRFAQPGDPCKYVINGKSYRGTIHVYNPDYTYSYVKDKKGITHVVYSAEVFPVLTYNYKSWR